MSYYSDSQLEALLDDIESDQAERKESWAGDTKSKGRQAVCAFANDLPNHNTPGVLFVGAKDNGTPSNIPIDDQLLLTLSDVKTDGKIIPPPSITVKKRVLKGAEIAVVTIRPADSPPVRYDGRIWIRTGPRRDIANAQDERILNEKRRFRDQPFDARPCSSAELGDLDLSWYANRIEIISPGGPVGMVMTWTPKTDPALIKASLSPPYPLRAGQAGRQKKHAPTTAW